MFCRAWSDPTSLLHSWIPFVFLEFDADVPSDPIPVPSVFVSLDWPIVDPAEPEAEQGVRSLTTAVVHDALYLLLGPNGLAPFAANLGACIDALPDSGRVLHAGAMLGRSACGARLSIAMPRAAQVGYLERFGLGRSAGIVESVMATLAPTNDRVHLELDVTETIGPRIGVVLACDRPEGWAELLARLDAERFCTADERAELMRWPISHLKITPAPSGMREAKAYLNLPRSSDENGLSR